MMHLDVASPEPGLSLTPWVGDSRMCWCPRAILLQNKGAGLLYSPLIRHCFWVWPSRYLWLGHSSRWLRASPWTMALPKALSCYLS